MLLLSFLPLWVASATHTPALLTAFLPGLFYVLGEQEPQFWASAGSSSGLVQSLSVLFLMYQITKHSSNAGDFIGDVWVQSWRWLLVAALGSLFALQRQQLQWGQAGAGALLFPCIGLGLHYLQEFPFWGFSELGVTKPDLAEPLREQNWALITHTLHLWKKGSVIAFPPRFLPRSELFLSHEPDLSLDLHCAVFWVQGRCWSAGSDSDPFYFILLFPCPLFSLVFLCTNTNRVVNVNPTNAPHN